MFIDCRKSTNSYVIQIIYIVYNASQQYISGGKLASIPNQQTYANILRELRILEVYLRDKRFWIGLTNLDLSWSTGIISSVYIKALTYSLITTVHTFNVCSSQPDVCQCLVLQELIDNMSKNKPSTIMTHVAYESNLGYVMRSSLHPSLEKWVAIGRCVVYQALLAHTVSAGIKCQHC